MKRSFSGLVMVGIFLWCAFARPALAQEARENKDNPSAYTALRLLGNTLGADAINRVVAVTGHDGKPQPTVWKIVLKEGEGSKEIDVANGKISAQRALSRPATGVPIKLPDLNLDSSGAFEATDTQARKVHVRFDSINYSLRTSDKTGKPLWTLDLLSESGVAAGTMKIAANNGAIASIEGRIATGVPPPAKPTAEGSPKPVLAPIRTSPTPKPVVATTTVDRSAPRRDVENVPPPTPAVTTTQAAPVQTTVVDIPDAGQPAAAPLPEEGGGFFTRTGRTLDHTSHNVNHSLDRASQDVSHSLRHAGATIQRFITGHSDLDSDGHPVPTPIPAEPD